MQIKTSMTTSLKFEVIEEGVWEADVTRIYDDEEAAYIPKPGEPPTRLGIRLEFTFTEAPVEGKKFTKFVGPGVNPRTHLWGLYKAILRREVTEEDLVKLHDSTEGIIEQMGGKSVKVIIQNVTSARGNEYSKLNGFMKSNRTQAIYPFEPGAPEGAEPVEQPPTQPVPNVQEAEDMDKVAEEVFGTDAPDTPPVPKASAKKVV